MRGMREKKTILIKTTPYRAYNPKPQVFTSLLDY